MKKLFLLCLLALPIGVQAQATGGPFSFRYDQTPAVTVNNRVLPNAWAGGLNASQFQTMRLNDDAVDDLVVFDRTSSKVSTFIWQNGTWQYAPEYEGRFPAIQNWLVLADYDGDGRKDLFVHGLTVYRNTVTNGQWAWQKVADPLLHQGFSSIQPLYVSPTDIPAIVDYDGDGDLDILAFEITGNSVVYHQNLSREKGNPAGLDYKRIGQCWGHFRKEFCNDFQFGINCDDANGRIGSPNAKVEHNGNTLTVVDTDGDGFKDLLFGFVSCTNIARIRNAGPNNEKATYVSADTLFPATKPIDFNIFPATFFEDVDGDGVKDLLAAPNVFSNDATHLDFKASNWFYKNTGTTEKPVFQYVTNDFLQSGMLDLGENAAPALGDLDGDGDADLLVGYNGVLTGATDFRGGIWQFENVGTAAAPAFKLVTTDYLNLAKTLLLTDLIPAFADANADGSPDLIITAARSNAVQIRVLLNEVPKGVMVTYDLHSAKLLTLPQTLGLGDVPVITDVDHDGKPDLLIGKASGNVEYLRNVGTADAPTYQLQNQSFGGIGVQSNGLLIRSPSIVVADFDADGKAELLTAAANGQLKLYRMPDQPDGKLTLLDSLSSVGFAGSNLLTAVADLNGDNLPDLMLGTGTGGLRYLRNTSVKAVITAVSEPVRPWVYPNPTTGFVTIHAPRSGQVLVFSGTGQAVGAGRTVQAGEDSTLDLSAQPDGVYLVRLTADNGTVSTQKVVLWR